MSDDMSDSLPSLTSLGGVVAFALWPLVFFDFLCWVSCASSVMVWCFLLLFALSLVGAVELFDAFSLLMVEDDVCVGSATLATGKCWLGKHGWLCCDVVVMVAFVVEVLPCDRPVTGGST